MPTESRTEQLLNAYINGDDISNFVPLSRNEQILKDMILGNEQTSSPQSRIESLYKKLDEKIKEGSGGGGDNILQYIIDKYKSTSCLFYTYIDGGTPYHGVFNNIIDEELFNLLSNINTINVTDMYGMFFGCSQITTIPKLNTSKVTNMSGMFRECSKLTTIPQLDTSKVTNMYSMFYSCSNLTTIPQLDISKINSTTFMFEYCSKLTYLKLLNVKVNLQIGSGTSWGHLIEKDCLIQIISELVDTGSSKTLTMGTANKAKIADTYVKLLEDDGTGKYPFEVCTSTDEGAMTIEAYCNSKNWTLA